MKTKTLKQMGYKIGGKALLNLWGGGQGIVTMDEFEIDKLSDSKIREGINDGQFGCESIECADIDIFELYQGDYAEFLKSKHYDVVSQENRSV